MAVINNSNSDTVLIGTSDDDTIESGQTGNYADLYGNNVTINSGAGNDSILNWYGSNVKIDCGAGNDSVSNSGEGATIDGGTGNDQIWSGAGNTSISGGAGDDSISAYGANVTIRGGKGDDHIYSGMPSSNNIIKYSAGDGNDIIQGFKTDSTLFISGSSYSTQISGNDVLVKVGSEIITLKNVFATADTIHINDKAISLERKAVRLADENISYSPVTITRDSVSVVGNAGNDHIMNYGNNVSIDGGSGENSLYNEGENVTIKGGADTDIVHSARSGESVSVDAGDGDDFINIYGANVTITGGKGNDHIYLGAYSFNNIIKYTVGDGNDLIQGFKTDSTLSISGSSYSTQISGNDVLVKVGKEIITLKNIYTTADTIHINGKEIPLNSKVVNLADDTNNNVTVNNDSISVVGGTGKDIIYNYGDNVTINSGDGSASVSEDDYIVNYGKNAFIDTGAGNDRIHNSGVNDTIDTGAGNDSIYNDGADVLISGGVGNDSVDNRGARATINGGVGNDFIDNRGSRATISGGKGDDLIWLGAYLSNNVIRYSAGDGNDTVQYFSSTDILNISGSYSTQASGNDVIVKVGSGSILLTDAKGIDLNIINAESGNSSYAKESLVIHNTKSNTILTGSSKKDTIQNGGYYDGSFHSGGSRVTIKAGAGNDFIYNDSDQVSIAGGPGNDAIENYYGDFVTIDGGAGDDYIYNIGRNNIIDGGKGNDHIRLNRYFSANNVIRYSAGGGNDTISNFSETDTLSISGGSYSTQTSGNDVPVKVGSEVITLKNIYATADTIHINDKTISLERKVVKLPDDNKNDIDVFRDSISVAGSAGADSIDNEGAFVTIDGGSGADYLSNEGENVILYGGEGDDYILNGGYNDGSQHYGGFASTISGGAGNDLIVNEWSKKVSVNGGDGNDSIRNWSANTTIAGGKGDDFIDLNIYNSSKDIRNAAALNNVIRYSAGDGSDTISGFSSTDTLKISGKSYSTQISGNDILVKVGKEIITLKNVFATADTVRINNKKISLAGKVIKLPDDINNSINIIRDSVSVIGSAEKDRISNSGDNVTILAGQDTDYAFDNDTIINYGKNVFIRAGKGNDTIYNYAMSSTIDSGRGNDSINIGNNSENNTIKYKAGDGNDSIYGFGSTDTLDISASYSTQASGNDVIVKVGSGSILLTGAKGKKLNIKRSKNSGSASSNESLVIDNSKSDTILTGSSDNNSVSNSGNRVTIFGNPGNDYIENSGAKAVIYGGADRDVIYSSGLNVTINGGTGSDRIYNHGMSSIIDGGAGDDTIQNSSYSSSLTAVNGGAGNDFIQNWGFSSILDGGAGNDRIYNEGTNVTITGGAGNDTLWGNGVANTFIYADGDGNDIIFGFEDDDMLQITGTFSASYSKKNKEVYFKVGDTSDAITLKDFTATSFNINGTNYKISGSKLVRS